jgi:hypothetical protein
LSNVDVDSISSPIWQGYSGAHFRAAMETA